MLLRRRSMLAGFKTIAGKLGSVEVGKTVTIASVGDFILVHQGNPDKTRYDASCNGTWLLLADAYQAGDYTTYTIVDGILDDHSTEPATVSESAVYKITLDFNTRGVTFEEVSKVIFNFAPRTEDNRDMAYAGNGCWKMTDYPVVFKQESWGLDERYNFRATIDGTEYVWGYVSNDSGTQSGEQPASYFYIYNYLYASITAEYPYFNYSFKFNTGLNGLTVDITVCMNGDTEHPTHIIDNIR